MAGIQQAFPQNAQCRIQENLGAAYWQHHIHGRQASYCDFA